MTSTDTAREGVGTFSRIVTHDQALEAARALINHYFRNEGGPSVYISIPAAPDNTDLLLVDYIKQQQAKATGASQ